MSDTLYLEKSSSVVSSSRVRSKWIGMAPAKTLPKQIVRFDERESVYPYELSHSTPETGRFLKSFIKRYSNEVLIKSFLSLPNNWNGNGAEAIDKTVVLKAISLLRELEQQPDIFPTARNTIQFEYEHGNDYLEIEIFEEYFNVYKSVANEEIEYHTSELYKLRKEVLNYHASIRNK